MARLKTAAVIHPAVPPPTITTRLTRKSLMPAPYHSRFPARILSPCRISGQKKALPARAGRASGKTSCTNSVEAVREPYRKEAAVPLPGEHLARIVVLVGPFERIGQIRARGDQSEALQRAAGEVVADLRVHGGVPVHVLLRAGRAEPKHLAEETRLPVVAHLGLEASQLVIERVVLDPLRQARDGHPGLNARIVDRAQRPIDARKDAYAVQVRREIPERQVGRELLTLDVTGAVVLRDVVEAIGGAESRRIGVAIKI